MIQSCCSKKIILEIVGHDFNNAKISSSWLSNIPYKIDELYIISSNFNSFENEAFDSMAFNDLKSMIIDGGFMEETTISFENIRGFVGLNNLKKLEIKNYDLIHSNQSFQGISSTLCSLSFINIKYALFLRSLFGFTSFPALKKLNISWNQLNSQVFNTTTFTGIQESLEELVMQHSQINNISAETFDNFARLKEIDLQNNSLTSLPVGIFQNFYNQSDFRVNLMNNPWRCDMDICHIIPFIKEGDNVSCASPSDLQGHPLIDTPWCSSTSTETSTSPPSSSSITTGIS